MKEEETNKKKMPAKKRSMSGKGKRRSARLLKLEEQKNDDKDGGCILDPWHIIRNSFSCAAQGKRKRNDEIQVKISIKAMNLFSLSRLICSFIYIFLSSQVTGRSFVWPRDRCGIYRYVITASFSDAACVCMRESS